MKATTHHNTKVSGIYFRHILNFLKCNLKLMAGICDPLLVDMVPIRQMVRSTDRFPKPERIISLLLAGILLSSTGCRGLFENDEKPCIAKDMVTRSGIFLGNYADEDPATCVLDVNDNIYIKGYNKVYGYPKDPKGVPFTIAGEGFRDFLVTSYDTIIHDYGAFLRFHPSTGQTEQLLSLGWKEIIRASVIPKRGIVYITYSELDQYSIYYFDFASGSNRALFVLKDLIPEIDYPFGQIQAFMKNDSMHMLLAYNPGIGIQRSPSYVYEVNLEKPEVKRRHILKDHSGIRIIWNNDFKTIGIAADPASETYQRDLFLLDMETGALQFKYRITGDLESDNYRIDGSHVAHLDLDHSDIATARLVNWITGETLITVKDSEDSFYFGGVVSNIGEDYLIHCNRLSNKALVVGRNNCAKYTLESTSNFRGILAATPEYVVALMEDGIVEMFRLGD